MKTLKRSECAVLPLVLKGKWYRMIESGVKCEEYRDATPYWRTRLTNWAWKKPGWNKAHHKTLIVAFSLGYQKPTMFFLARPKPYDPCGPYPWSLVTTNNSAWGEPSGIEHYIIALDERVELED